MYTSMFRKAMLGDTATLNLDFSTGVLDSRLTFTRASTATYINSSGYITTASTNVARFDYDPVTLAPRGLLIEGSATNVCLRSQELTTDWVDVNMITPTNPAIADPFGGTSATWKLVAASGFNYHCWRHPYITATAAAYTFSFWAKAAEYDRVMFSDIGTGLGACAFVLTGNGTATVFGGATNPQITPYTGGWYRCSVTMTTLASTYAFGIAGYPETGTTLNSNGARYTGTGTDGVYATALQIELGSGASSYIPTAASQVTRNADGVVMNDISSLGYSTQVGSIYWSGIINKQPIAYSTLIGFMTAGDQPTFETFGNALNYFSAARGSGLSTGGSNEVFRPYTLGSNIRYASSVNTLVNPIIQVNLNGSANSTTKTGTGDMYLATRFVIGRGASYVLNYPSVTIKQIRYYPEFKTAAQLQALTAP